jgi:pimeloyl-ACP methyl ester carboxylesterase
MTFRLLPALVFLTLCAQQAFAQGAGADTSDRLVDVGGGRRLHVKCTGAGARGAPTVVLESGAANGADVWERVRPGVEKFARVCAYDRAGVGTSDPVDAPRTVAALAEDLHALLSRAQVPGPYVLVGHSLGGILVRVYASLHPSEVAGVVLVDSAHEDEPDRLVALTPPGALKEMLRQARPEDLVINSGERVDSCTIRTILGALNWHADVPLVVLTQGIPYGPDMVAVPSTAPAAYRLHLELQRELARRSPRGRQIIAAGSGHAVHQDRPDLVVNAVREVFRAAARGKARRLVNG